jgi:DNA-binding transcriptional ArsR family regulator
MEIDRKTLKALAGDTRLDILKSLSYRRKMPSELSKELNLAPSTIIEHLNKLEEANLVKREETGHKWIYYSLTDEGENLIKPSIPVQFVLVLSISLIVIFAGFVYINYTNSYAALAPLTKGAPSVGQETGGQPNKTAEGAATAGVIGNITNQTNTTNTTITNP